MKQRLTTVALVVLLVSTAATLGCRRNEGPTPEPRPTVRIGLPTPLTGGSAIYGRFIREGAEMAADEIEASGRIGSTRLEVVVDDGKGEPEETRKAVRRLIGDKKVSVLMGAFLSNATLAVADIADHDHIPLIVESSTADKITAPGHPYVFRVCAPNSILARRLGEWVVADGHIKRVGYVFEKTEFGQNLAGTVRDVLERSGIQTVAYEGVTQHETNLLSVVQKMKAARPDAVFIGLIADSALPFLQQAHEAGFTARWLNAASVSNPVFLHEAGSLAAGFVGVSHYLPTANDQSKAFASKFEQRYHSTPTPYSVLAYDTVFVIADAVKRGGSTPAGINRALRSTSWSGVTGPIRFDANGQASLPTLVFLWDGTSLQPVAQ